MWWSDRRRLMLALAAGLLAAGCGFSPVYGPQGSGQHLLGTIRANDPASRRDFQFVSAFEERLGRAEAVRWTLGYQIAVSSVSATLFYTLTPVEGGAAVASGSVSVQTRFSDIDIQFSTIAAAEDTELRLMRQLADLLVTRLYTEPGLRE